MLIVHRLPVDYRWATAVETENWQNLTDAIQVRVGGTDADPWTDIAVPRALLMPCFAEFGDHEHDENECARLLDDMGGGYFDDTDYSAWYGGERGYNDGLRWSDFV